MPVGGTVSFSTDQQRGAVLVVPGPAPIICIDALSKEIERYKLYVISHMDGWIPFVKAIGLKLSDLMLVTGVDRTTLWSTAAFARQSGDIGFDLNVQYPTIGSVHVAPEISWRHDTGIITNTTPTPAGGDTPNTELNQTLFVRRLRAKHRFWGVSMKANAEPRDPDLGDGSDDWDMNATMSSSIKMEESPVRSDVSHASIYRAAYANP